MRTHEVPADFMRDFAASLCDNSTHRTGEMSMAERHLCIECNWIVDSDHDPVCKDCRGTGEVPFLFGEGNIQCLDCHGMGRLHGSQDRGGEPT
jgi:DnaJ-class molecular chaperone